MGLLITNGETSISNLDRPIANTGFKLDTVKLFEDKCVSEWDEVYDLKVKHSAPMRDLTGIVVQEKPHWHRGPFKLGMVQSRNGNRT